MTEAEQNEVNKLAEFVAKTMLLIPAIQVSVHPLAHDLRTACYRILEIKTAKQAQAHIDAARALMERQDSK